LNQFFNILSPFIPHFEFLCVNQTQVCTPPPHVIKPPQNYTLVSWAIDHGFWRVHSLAACMTMTDQVTDIVVTQSNRKSGEWRQFTDLVEFISESLIDLNH
jgi:hypothetical protein